MALDRSKSQFGRQVIFTDHHPVVLWSGVRLVCVMLTKWFSSPRLETRTKESNICASIGVANSHAQ
jgi:hypothetical protein